MLNNKVLLVVNSVYQLFTAVHMKRSILAKKEADLLVTDITAVLHTYIPRLKETGLFAQVIFGKTKEWNQKYAAAKGGHARRRLSERLPYPALDAERRACRLFGSLFFQLRSIYPHVGVPIRPPLL